MKNPPRAEIVELHIRELVAVTLVALRRMDQLEYRPAPSRVPWDVWLGENCA